MIKISLVGDIGSGKTYISKLFRAPCFSADLEVIKLYKTSKNCFRALKKKFPKFIKSFPIRKKELTQVINKNFSNLKKIGSIVHPFIRKRFNHFIKENYKSKMVVLDVPLYLENKLNKKKDIIIFLKTKKKRCLQKIKKKKKF